MSARQTRVARVPGSGERISRQPKHKDGCWRHLQIASGTSWAEELLQFASIIAVDRRGFDTVKINYVIVKATDKDNKKQRGIGRGWVKVGKRPCERL